MPTHQVPLVLKYHSLNLYCSFPLFQSYHAAAIKKLSGPAMWLYRRSESPQTALEVRAQRDILIYYCLFSECNHKTPKVQSMKWHWECAHGASKAQSKELKSLPLIVDMVRNRHFRHPGNCHPLLPPGRVPAGSNSLQEKGELLVRVSCVMTPRSELPEERRVVRIAAPPSATITAPKDPLPPSLPPPSPSSRPSKPARRCRHISTHFTPPGCHPPHGGSTSSKSRPAGRWSKHTTITRSSYTHP